MRLNKGKYVVIYQDKKYNFELNKATSINKLISMFNKKGMRLGSGHDGIELYKDKEIYRLELELYVGAFTQEIIIKKL